MGWFSDIPDWFRLRRRLAEPWRFLRDRKARIDGTHYDVRLADGRTVRLLSAQVDRQQLFSIFGRDEYRVNGLEPLGTVVDIGSHVGVFALRIAPLAQRIVCYEPEPTNHALLVENLRALPNVSVHRKAVSAGRGRATLHVSSVPDSHSMHAGTLAGTAVSSVEVETVGLADVFAENGVERCDLLKVDAEGAEYDIVYSAPADLWARVERVAMEYHDVPGGRPEWSGRRLADYLQGAGHRVELAPRRRHPLKGLLFSRRISG